MASEELAAKLSRRMHKCEADNDDDENQSIDNILNEKRKPNPEASGDADELTTRLSTRRTTIDNPESVASDARKKEFKVFNPYTEFPEFSRKTIQNLQVSFKSYDYDKDNFIDFSDLKRMMEKLGCPQTHLGLKHMIAELDEDKDNKISFREFLMLFRRARAGEFQEMDGLLILYNKYVEMQEIAVEEVGVKEAKNFFESKIDAQNRAKTFEEEIRHEQEEKAREAEEKKKRKEEFKNKQAIFK